RLANELTRDKRERRDERGGREQDEPRRPPRHGHPRRRVSMTMWSLAVPAVLTIALSGCERQPVQLRPSAATLTALGRAIFFDTTLSASGRIACSSCHDPRHDWGPPDARAVQLAGQSGTTPGIRAVPSLAYGQDTPA